MKMLTMLLTALLVAVSMLADTGRARAGDAATEVRKLGATGLKMKAPAPPVVRRHLVCQVTPAGRFSALTGNPTVIPGAYVVTNNFQISIPTGTAYTITAGGKTHIFTSTKVVNFGEKIAWLNYSDFTAVPCQATIPF